MPETKYQQILLRRGAAADVPTLAEGEPGYSTDSEELFIGTNSGTRRVLNPVYGLMYTPLDYIDKPAALNQWTRVSGTGTMSYTASDSVIGTGCWSFSGTGLWAIRFSIPCNPALGIGGFGWVRQSTGTGTFSLGYRAHNSSDAFIANDAMLASSSATAASWTQYRNHNLAEGAGSTNLPTGTRFVRGYIDISANTGTILLDHFMLMPLGFAGYAIYT